MESAPTTSLPIDSYCYASILKCNHRLSLIQSKRAYALIFDSLTIISKKFTVKILAYTILPDRIQLITCGLSSKKIPSFYEAFKNVTRNEIIRILEQEGQKDVTKQLRLNGHYDKYKVWETLYTGETIKTLEVLESTVREYHQLAVLKKLAETPEAYSYSSAPFYELEKIYGIKVADYRKEFNLSSI